MPSLRQLLAPFVPNLPWRNVDGFLDAAQGVIHVGANTGQEREKYAAHQLPVAWIEPIPSVFSELVDNIRNFPDQAAYQYLLADRDGELRTLHIANNGGASSSILKLAKHKKIFPHVGFVDDINLVTITLPTLVSRESIPLEKYDLLVLDTQGSELLILRGAKDILSEFKFIKTEVADFESYEGCARPDEIKQFLLPYGFKETARKTINSRAVGKYFDMLFTSIS